MRFRVRDVRLHLELRNISAETFAKEVGLSHMTIRRWIRLPANSLLPEKYSPILYQRLGGQIQSQVDRAKENEAEAKTSSTFNSEDLMSAIHGAGKSFKGQKELEADLDEKLSHAKVDATFLGHCKSLLHAIRSPSVSARNKAICIGALLYFINPIDLIPDHLPVIGYLDDFAVLSLAVSCLVPSKESKKA